MAAGSCQNSEGLVHDVFLSFRGEDVRKSFIDHLRSGLKREGITAIFYDDTGLERGEEIQSKLYEAIDRSKMAIVTFSPRYAESRWCLDELVRIMERRSSHSLMVVLPVFYNVDPTHVRHQTGPYQEEFRKHKVAKIDRVNKWRQALASAADLAGFGLQNQANGYEAKFIELIVNEAVRKLDPRLLDVPKYMVGRESYIIRKISKWLQNGSSKVEVGIIYGSGGVGKTTTAKVVYNGNCRRFKSRSFLANIRTAYGKDSDFIRLQTQLIRNITGNEDIKIDSVFEGKQKIKNVIGTQEILVILDDVDEVEQFHAMFDCPDWFISGSKILITTRNKHLLINDASIVRFEARLLDQENSVELFSYHAFGQAYPPKNYMKISILLTEYCDGLPLALEILASSLRSIRIEMWELQYARLQENLDNKVFNVLSWSFDALQDIVKDIFLHIAFYMVGRKKEYALKILDGCGLHGKIGLEDLIGKCLVSVGTLDEFHDILSMHHLVQQVGYEVVRRNSPTELGYRSRILGQKDAYKVLRKKMEKSAVKGLHLNISDPHGDDISSNEMYVGNSARHMRTTHIHLTNPSRQVLQYLKPIKTNAFTKMENLDLLLLENVKLDGGFEDFPKEIKWLLWKGCPLHEIPLDFELDELVVLDMQKSCLVHAWNGLKYMGALKILNLNHSHQLVSTPDFSTAGTLEWISCEDCIRLVEVHESIGKLENLTQLNLKGCIDLVTLPESIRNLEKLTIIRVKGCRNLRNLPINTACSIKCLNLEGCPGLFMGSSQVESTTSDLEKSSSVQQHPVSCPPPPFRFNIFLPSSLKKLSLANCRIHRDDVMEMISCARSLRRVDLSGNPIRVLSSMNRGPCLRLEMLVLNDCHKLESVSNILWRCRLRAKHCDSLTRITYYRHIGAMRKKQRLDLTEAGGCGKLVAMEYEVWVDMVIERVSEMDEDRARYLGYPNLSAVGHAGTGHGFYGRGAYQAGIYSVCIRGSGFSMLAKWFPTASLSRTNFFKHYRVPSCHGNEQPVRALNIGFLVINYSVRLVIKNISRMWKWTYNLPWGTSFPVVKNKEIYVDSYRCMGATVMYEDGEGEELEEEKFPFAGWPKIRTETTSEEEKIIQFDNQNGGEEKNDDSADVAAWYNHIFRSIDLSFYEVYNYSTLRLYDVNNLYANTFCT
uniref:TIR domain-containing protein n=1 Tax=Kalanchoe fedtschenkoi TaxID=63787 RepID=A0A7N0TX53_KALFE